jgi:RimJ/RimL family protein N-acetyltransferase
VYFPKLIEGKRIKLTPMELSHSEELFESGRYKEIWTYMPNKMDSLNDMIEFIDSALRDKETGLEYPFVVYDKELHKIVGSTRFLNISIPNRNLEIGYTWYSPEVWRSCVNTECKYELLKYCFEEFKAVRVQLKADVRNERSN